MVQEKVPTFAVQVSSIKANVDLLIGTNAPRLLEPWEVVNRCGYGPYAIRTVLGWVINGPLKGNCSNDEMKLSSVVVNRISVSNSKIMESSATPQEERYCLMLPFNRPDAHLPNSFKAAKQRILGVRKRFMSNPKFHREYSSGLNDVIKKDYAERMPLEQSQGRPGKVWYIPHYARQRRM